MRVYTELVSEKDADKIKTYFNAMSEEKKNSVLKIKNEKKANQRIVADGLLRNAVSDFCGINPENIVFEKNEYGKPFAVNADVFFSVSHSDDAVVCALSENEIGIDIEKIRDINIKSAKRFATDEELAYIGNSVVRFFEIWTLKEAYFKCIGTGLNSNIKNVSFIINGDSAECSEKGYKCRFLPIVGGYCCSICEKISDTD